MARNYVSCPLMFRNEYSVHSDAFIQLRELKTTPFSTGASYR
jgi:hypothetical protein